jgi:Tfp pilus assembly protein PilV
MLSLMSATRTKRRGATLIELLVAILLFDLTLLALVAASAVTARRIGEANRRQRALVATTSRVESILASPCLSIGTGHGSLERGTNESWSTTQVPGGRVIADTVTFAQTTNRPVVAQASQPC